MGGTRWKFKIKRKKPVNVSGSTAGEQSFVFFALSTHMDPHNFQIQK